MAEREPTPTIDWTNLSFNYLHTKSHLVCRWRNGVWDSEPTLVQNDNKITMDIAATALHYGQTCFEGLKAFRHADGKVRIFRPQLNARRIRESCRAASLPEPPEELFMECVRMVVSDNIAYVPPLNHGGSLYIRPVVLGVGPQIGLSEATEVVLIVFVNPVGDYYKGGMSAPVSALIAADIDRSAPRGTGHVKLGGNYAPVFGATKAAKTKGHTLNLFLDSKTHKFIDEFATSNFAAVGRDEGGGFVYVTPRSGSVLPGVTNRSLAEMASRLFGWRVEKRAIEWEEVKSGKFSEVAACGTAVVITPIGSIHREVVVEKGNASVREQEVGKYDWDLDEIVGVERTIETEVVELSGGTGAFKTLYDAYRSIQSGTLPEAEHWGWMWPSEGI